MRRLILPAILVILGLLTAVTVKLFTIQQIIVIGNGVNIQLNENGIPHNLLFFPSRKFENLLTKNNPLVKTIIIQKKYPDTLVLTIVKRMPLACVNNQYLIDGDSIVISQNSGCLSYLSIITDLAKSYQPGEKIDNSNLNYCVELIKYVGAFLQFDKFEATNSASITAKVGKTTIVFTQDSNAGKQATTLQTMFDGFRIKGTLPTVIDLRFNKPSVTF